MTLNRRVPASFSALYAPNGDYFRYRSEALSEAYKAREDAWMKHLRAEAGLSETWAPSDENKNG